MAEDRSKLILQVGVNATEAERNFAAFINKLLIEVNKGASSLESFEQVAKQIEDLFNNVQPEFNLDLSEAEGSVKSFSDLVKENLAGLEGQFGEVVAAYERLKQVQSGSLETAQRAAVSRAAGLEKEQKSVKELEAEVRQLENLFRSVASVGDRLVIQNALRAAKTELRLTSDAAGEFNDQLQRIRDKSVSVDIDFDAEGVKSLNAEISALATSVDGGGGGGEGDGGLVAGLESVGSASELMNELLGSVATGGVASLRPGLNALKDGLGKVGSAFGLTGDAAIAAGAAVTASVVAVTAYIKVAKDAADAAAEYAKGQYAIIALTGASQQTAAGLSLAFKTVDGSINDVSDALAQYKQLIGEARDNNEDSIQTLKNLGLTQREIQNLGFDQLVARLAERFGQLPDSIEKTTAIQKAFGEEGSRQFAAVAGELAAFNKLAQESGLILSNAQRTSLAGYSRSLAILQSVLEGLAIQAGSNTAPAIAGVADATTEFLRGLNLTGPGAQQTVKGLADTVFGLISASIKFLSVASDVNYALLSWMAPVKLIGPILEHIGDTIQAILSPIQTLSVLIGDFKFSKDFDRFLPILNTLIGNIHEFANAGKDAGEKVKIPDDTLQSYKDLEKAVKSSGDAFDTANTQISNSLGALRIDLDEQLRTGTINGVQAAQTYLDAVDNEQQKAYEALKKSTDAQNSLLVRKMNDDINREGVTAEEKKKIRAKFTADQEKLFADSEAKTLALVQQRIDAQRALEQAAAEDRARRFKRESDQVALYQREQTNRIQIEEEKGIISAEQATNRRIELARQRVANEIAILQQQRAEENVSAEERKRIDDEIYERRNELRQIDLDAELEVNAAKLRDVESKHAREKAILEERKSEIELMIAQRRQQGVDEITLATQQIQMEQALLEASIRRLETEISEKRELNGATAELIQLEDQLNKLKLERVNFAQRAAGILEDAYNREAAAAGNAANAAGNVGKAAEDAAARAKQAHEAGLAAFISYVQSLAGQAQALTSETVVKGIEDLKALVAGYRETSLFLIASYDALFDWAATQAEKALMEAYKKQNQFVAEERAKREAERQAEADRLLDQARSEAEALNSEREDRERDHIREMRDLNRQLTQLESDTAERKLAITEQSGERIQSLRDQLTTARLRHEKEEADRVLQIQRDLENSRRDLANSSGQNLENQRQENIGRRSDLEAELEQAKAEGDVARQSELQKQLLRLGEDEKLAEEQAAAEAEAAKKARSAEELQILLEGIRKQFEERQKHIDLVRSLEGRGQTALIAQAEASYARELALIQQATQDKLNDLTTRLEREQTQRDEANKAELDALEKQISDEEAARDRALVELQKDYDERHAELEKAINREARSYQKFLDDMASQTAAFAEKFGASVEEILAGINAIGQAAGSLGGVVTTGGGGGGGGGATVGGGSGSGGPSSTSGGGGGGGGGASVGGGSGQGDIGAKPPPNTQTAGGGGGGQGRRGGSPNNNDITYDLTKTLSQSQYDAYQANLDICREAIAAYKGGDSPFDEAWAVVRGFFSEGKISLTDFGLFSDEINAIRDAQENQTGKDITSDAGTTVGVGTLGDLTTTGPGRESPGPPATPPSTEPPSTQETAAVRDEKLANDLIFKAENIQTAEDRQAVIERANAAFTAKKIDEADMGKIKSALDYYSFQRGIDIKSGSQLMGGAAVGTPGPKPGSPGQPGATAPPPVRAKVTAPSPTMNQRRIVKEAAEASRNPQQVQNTQIDIKGDSFDVIIEKLRKAAKEMGIKGA